MRARGPVWEGQAGPAAPVPLQSCHGGGVEGGTGPSDALKPGMKASTVGIKGTHMGRANCGGKSSKTQPLHLVENP